MHFICAFCDGRTDGHRITKDIDRKDDPMKPLWLTALTLTSLLVGAVALVLSEQLREPQIEVLQAPPEVITLRAL
ncbi:hypothetical protein A9Q95_00505 [Rhodobacterales bacterium 59_46_T64]|nr:hypothetical protein A9Q95_00505 [Rhodobacterales bacterium 59_46_T64]